MRKIRPNKNSCCFKARGVANMRVKNLIFHPTYQPTHIPGMTVRYLGS